MCQDYNQKCVVWWRQNFLHTETKEDLVKATVEAEVASGQEAGHIATIEAELAALRLSAGQSQLSERGRAFTRDLRRARDTSRGGAAGGSGSLTHKQKVSNRMNWIFCFKCKQWGIHRANECKFSEAQLRELTPMDDNKIPSSAPYDPHFNLLQTGGSMSTIGMNSKN